MTNSVLPEALVAGVQDQPEIPTRTFYLDLANGRIARMTDGLEAIRQAAMIALLSERFRSLVFSNQYGSELKAIIGRNYPKDLEKTEIERACRDALSRDERITSVEAVATELRNDEVYVEVDLETILGNTTVEVIL